MPYVAMPNSGQNLDQTRDQIRNNIQALKDSLAVNHGDLDKAFTGKHRMTNFYPISSATLKPTTTASEVALYNDSSVTGQIWLCPPNTLQGDKKVQLTAGDVTDANFAQSSGWTFLPGGLLMQWGKITNAASGNFTYLVPFSLPAFSISFTPYWSSGSAPSGNVTYFLDEKNQVPSATKFFWIRSGSTSYSGFYWIAIGKA